MPAERGQILLVEDDPTTAGTMAQRLRIEGYGVEVATGAVEAAASLERRVPDLLLSDLHLPDGSGEELRVRHAWKEIVSIGRPKWPSQASGDGM